MIKRGRPRARDFMVELLDALHQVAQRGEVQPDPGIARLRNLLANPDPAIAAAAARTLGAWKVSAAAPELLALIRDGQRPDNVRAAAALALAHLERPESVQDLRGLATSGDIESRYFAVRGLTVTDLAGAGSAAAMLLAEEPGRADPAGLVAGFLQRDRGPEILERALADRTPASYCTRSHSSALDLADRLISEPDCSTWLRGAVIRALGRDPVDAVADAEILLSILSARLEEIQGGAK
jgi:HEAT repeat protein